MVACSGVRSPTVVTPPATEPPPEPSEIVWDGHLGLYAKIEQNQFDSNGVGQEDGSPRVHFPSNYISGWVNNNSFSGSVYYELLKYKWIRGIQIDLDWGKIDNGNADPDTWNWGKYDAIFEAIEFIHGKGGNGLNKKVMFLITWKTFDIVDATRVLPGYMQTTGTQYASDFPRYDHLWGYSSTGVQPGASGRGYHYRFADFQDDLDKTNGVLNGRVDRNGTPIYTFRDAYRRFLAAAYNRYKDNPIFTGFLTIEPSPLSPADTSTNFNDGVQTKKEFVEPDHFAGRLTQLKWMRATFTNHMLVEAPNHNTTYQNAMTMGADGCAANGLGFTGPNMHQGTNIPGLYNARKYLGSVGATPGVVPLITQCQPQDMKDIKGNTPAYWWTWNQTSPNYGGKSSSENAPGRPSVTGQPLTQNANTGVAVPATLAWVYTRAFEYQRGNILSYQRNLATDNPFNWDDLIAAVEANTTLTSPNTGDGLIQDDPSFGAILLEPDRVV